MDNGWPFDCSQYVARYRTDGYAIFPELLGERVVEHLRAVISAMPPGEAVRRKTSVYGVRNLLETAPEICALAVRPEIWQLVTPILGDSAFATRAIFFNKTRDANWTLGWHQDSVISIAEKRDVPGFLAWGQKAGVWQVQPPAEVLAKMLAIRVHLDDCGPDNGPLRVLAGSHRHGWLDNEISEWKHNVRETVCTVACGGVVVMCPLLLHASSKAIQPTQRRVIHIEYANEDLPGGLEWNQRLCPSTIHAAGAS